MKELKDTAAHGQALGMGSAGVGVSAGEMETHRIL